MSASPEQRKLTRILVGVCVVLTVMVGIQLLLPAETATEQNAVPVSMVPERADLPEFHPPAIGSYAEILERPLFYKSRRLPTLPQDAPPEAAPLEPLQLSLEGVAIANSSKVALLRDQKGNELIRLAEGMSHNGWVLESVESSGAAFRRGQDVTELEFEPMARNPRRRFRR